jgi:hypothetical protein
VNDAAEYLAFVTACIIAHPEVEQCLIVREEAQGDMGLFRYRLTLRGGDLLEMFERFQVVEGRVQVTKYSFHWQSGEGNVQPHAPISAEEVLTSIASARDPTRETECRVIRFGFMDVHHFSETRAGASIPDGAVPTLLLC